MRRTGKRALWSGSKWADGWDSKHAEGWHRWQIGEDWHVQLLGESNRCQEADRHAAAGGDDWQLRKVQKTEIRNQETTVIFGKPLLEL